MRETYRRPSLFWPVIFIGLGVLLLLQNLGYLPAGLFAALAQLWPAVFILIGLDMLLGRRGAAAAGAVLLAAALIVAGALTWGALRAAGLPPASNEPVFQFGHEAESLDVRIDFKAGALEVGALGESPYVMEGELRHGAGEAVRQRYAVRAGVGRLGLAQQSDPLLLPFLAGRRETARWAVRLRPDLPLRLDVRTGAGRSELDLAGLALTALELRTGVGQTRLTFPAEGQISAELRTGVGATTVIVPAELPARITIEAGLAQVSVPAEYAQSGETYTTPGFDTRGDYLELVIEAGVGKVEITH